MIYANDMTRGLVMIKARRLGEAAKQLKINRCRFSRILNRHVTVRPVEIRKISEYLNLNPDQIFEFAKQP